MELEKVRLAGYSICGNSACQTKGGKNIVASHNTTASLIDDRGIWTVKGRVYDPLTGRMKQRSKSTGLYVKNSTKRKAEAAMKTIVDEWQRQAASVTPKENPSMKTCIERWLGHKSLTLRAVTLDGYNAAVNAHIIPELGEIGVCDLTRHRLQEYFEKLHRAGISSNTMKKHRVIIRGALKDALLDDLISVNVADQISLPRGKKFEGKALTDSQMTDVVERMNGLPEPVHSVVLFALIYGLRRSEICGLRWEDVDFENKVIRIRNTITEYKGIHEEENTKTRSSCRDLYFVPGTEQYLVELLKTQKQSGTFPGKVCSRPDGKELRPSYCTEACKKFLESCGITGIRLHDLRGTAATILARKGESVKRVQAYLGHSDIQTTLKYYVHLVDADKVATADAMGEILAGCSGNCSGKSNSVPDNIIPINAIAYKKLTIK